MDEPSTSKGATNIANTGSLPITRIVSPNVIEYTNENGVADLAYTGRWDVIGARVARGTGDRFDVTIDVTIDVTSGVTRVVVTLADAAALFTAVKLPR